jgi:plastocyanin
MNLWILLQLLVCLAFMTSCSRNTTKDNRTVAEPAAAPTYVKVDPATAGVLTGKIQYGGKKPASRIVDLDQDPECVRAHGKRSVPVDEISVNRSGDLANVFVYIKSGLEGKKFEPPAAAAVIDQKGCWFHPRVVGIQAGQTLSVTNSDPLTHNIHPMAQLNREWNQSQAPGDAPLKRRFVRPEIMIPVKCNIHGWMRSFIGVVDHPYFAVTGSDGSFEIKNVPPGSYTIAAWHEKLGTKDKTVALSPSGTASADFHFKGE